MFDHTKYKAIVCDFDGTLVGKVLTIPQPVQDAIRTLTSHDMTFTIASGRSFEGPLNEACKALHLNGPQIVRGGAEIIDPITKKVLIQELIPQEELQMLHGFLEKNDIEYTVEKNEFIYTRTGEYIKELGNVPMKKLSELEWKHIPKIVVHNHGTFADDEMLEKDLISQFQMLHIVKAHSPSGKAWDITAAMANKHIAVIKIAQLLNISPKEIIGIGDGYNDFPLLEACGYKIAVENANNELKTIADLIIPSYSDNGVAYFINHYIAQYD